MRPARTVAHMLRSPGSIDLPSMRKLLPALSILAVMLPSCAQAQDVTPPTTPPNPPPSYPPFSASPTSGSAPLLVTFGSTGFGTITFGDGSTGAMSGGLPTCFTCGPAFSANHTYSAAGTYTATFTPTCTGTGCTPLAPQKITITVAHRRIHRRRRP